MNTLEKKIDRARKNFRVKMLLGAFAGAVLLGGALAFAFFFHGMRYQITPPAAAENATVSLAEGIGVALSRRAYLLGARATLRVESPGYITRTLDVNADARASLVINLQVAPARVTVTTQPELAQTRWRVNGEHAFTGARLEYVLQPGATRIDADHEFYQVETLQLDAQRGDEIMRHLIFRPLSGGIHVNSEPAGARVFLDDRDIGVTPLEIPDLTGGEYLLRVALAGYEDAIDTVAITNAAVEARRSYRLKPKRADVRVNVAPAGGVLFVDGARATPGVLSLVSGRKYFLRYEKPGYVAQSREVTPPQPEVSFALKIETGEVEFRSAPSAELFIGGKRAGVTPLTVQLQTIPQKISMSSEGYRTLELTVTPKAAATSLIEKKLQSELDARLLDAPKLLTAAAGVELKLFDPRAQSRFTMGAPDSDQQRRANEFRRKVHLTKPFYAGLREITEEQFANYKKIKAAGKNLPVRNVTWIDAAGFANWMSAQDGLQPAYQFDGGNLRGFDARADGYRLLSEAEWEWLARVAGRVRTARFVWGNQAVIPQGSGNFADESAKGNLPAYIPRYDDGFASVAPVASFAADTAGLYDVAGNLSEWVHDAHDLRPPADEVMLNPFGRASGRERVVKGASFRSASLVQLRASYRQGVLRPRDDVGFRVARYLYGAGE